MIFRAIFLISVFAVLQPPAARADTFIDAAIKRMVELKDNYKKQYGSEYTGGKSKAGLTVTDCFRYSRAVLIGGFTKIGAADAVSKIEALYEDGGDVAKYLVEKRGWRAYFWAPDVRAPGDAEFEHIYELRIARTEKKHYYQNQRLFPEAFVPLSGYIVNYNPTPLDVYMRTREVKAQNEDEGIAPARTVATRKNTRGSDYLETVPFCFGMTSGASHTFLVAKGMVYEVHFKAYGPDSPSAEDTSRPDPDPAKGKLYEISSFKGDFTNYTKDGWMSGLVVCPPQSPEAPAEIATFDPGI